MSSRYELYVGGFYNHSWTIKSLCDYFYRLIEGIQILDCHFYPCANERLQNQSFAILILNSISSIDQCLAKRDQIKQEHNLTVQRHLREVSRDQKIICSYILIHLKQYDQSFTIENVSAYFGQYGSIIQWKIFDNDRTFLLNFEDYDSVDRIILDQPHFLNDQLILIRKCYNPHNLTITCSIENLLNERIRNLQAGIDREKYLHEFELRKLEKQIQEEEDRLADIMRSYIRLERIQRDLKQDLIVARQINQQLKKQLQDTLQKNQSIVNHYENQLRSINKSLENLF